MWFKLRKPVSWISEMVSKHKQDYTLRIGPETPLPVVLSTGWKSSPPHAYKVWIRNNVKSDLNKPTFQFLCEYSTLKKFLNPDWK